MNEIAISDWYLSLVEDCKAIITEAVFTSRWALVEGYHQLGERIVTDDNFKKFSKGNLTSLSDLIKNLEVSQATVYRAIAFYEKYPSLDSVPEGKNISWNKIVTKYLPSPKSSPTPDLPPGKYSVIYADPPWKYDFSQSDSRKIENQYPTMELDEICKLPIADIAGDDCVLFLWATSPKLVEAMQVVSAWGFAYKTCAVWVKDKIGMGYYFRQRHELLLVATKGEPPVPPASERPDSVMEYPRGEHSAKPAEVQDLIDGMYPDWLKVELFARANERKGWVTWGNQA